MNKNEKSLWHTWERLVCECINQKPVLIIYFTAFIVMGCIQPLLSSVQIKTIVKVILGNGELRSLIWCVVIFSIGLLIVLAVKAFCQTKADSIFTYLRMTYSKRVSFVFFRMPYKKLEDGEFLNKYYKAFSSLESSSTGVERILNLTFYLISEVASLIGLALIYGTIKKWIPFTILVFACIRVYVKLKEEKERIRLKIDLSKEERRFSYNVKICSEVATNREIRINKAFEFIDSKFQQSIVNIVEQLRNIRDKIQKIENKSYYSVGIIMFIMLWAISASYNQGRIDVSDVSMYLSMFLLVLNVIESIAKECGEFLYEMVNVKQLYAFLDNMDERLSKEDECLRTLLCPSGRIVYKMKNVSYKYSNRKEYALNNINLEIEEGEKVAIVGLNGAGKSTLIKCLSGIYDDYEGQIELNGKNLKDITLDVLYNTIGVLFQDTCLYAFSLSENIASSDTQIDEKKIEECLKLTGISSELESINIEEQVLKVIDKKGIVFSEGESQKISFARILYKDSPIVILDEPTSGMDVFAEKKMFELMKSVSCCKTVICITHRLSALKNFDRIILIEKGEVLECGDHEALMRKKGRYYEIYNVQKKYYDTI